MAAYTTIDDPSAHFKVQLYTGNGSANHAITFDDTDTDMQPDLVIIKIRASNYNHSTFDSVRGVNKGFYLNEPAAEHDSNNDGYYDTVKTLASNQIVKLVSNTYSTDKIPVCGSTCTDGVSDTDGDGRPDKCKIN